MNSNSSGRYKAATLSDNARKAVAWVEFLEGKGYRVPRWLEEFADQAVAAAAERVRYEVRPELQGATLE